MNQDGRMSGKYFLVLKRKSKIARERAQENAEFCIAVSSGSTVAAAQGTYSTLDPAARKKGISQIG
jgi:hypothetical protein